LNKLSKTLLITFLGLFSINPSYAFDVFSLESDTTNNLLKVYGVDLITKEKTFLTEKNLGGADPSSAGRNSYVNPNSGELVIITSESGQEAYNWRTNTWRTIDESLFPSSPHILQMPSANGDGSSEVISVGENSLKLKETSTSQEMWATDSSGSIAPINITNGTKLLINGRDIEQSIDNVGALSAALTALPTVPTDSPIACGIGTGTHSGNYAFSGGCASKVNEKLSFNAAASFVPGQDYQGTDNSYSARAGFVFKLGRTSRKELISKKEKQLDQKVSDLQTENKELKNLIVKQNARLEKLEEIALAFKIRKDLEIISLAE